jgi:hypothetical protein
MSTNTRYLPKEQLIQRALEALMTSLGPVEATRFLTLAREERLESVIRHQQWQATLDREVFYDAIFNDTTFDDSS